MEIKAQWWIEDERPIIQVDIGGMKVNLTRLEGGTLVDEVGGCLNGIIRQMSGAALLAEVKRRREQVRIAEDVLNHIILCNRAPRDPGPRELAHARTLADDALTRMDAVE